MRKKVWNMSIPHLTLLNKIHKHKEERECDCVGGSVKARAFGGPKVVTVQKQMANETDTRFSDHVISLENKFQEADWSGLHETFRKGIWKLTVENNESQTKAHDIDFVSPFGVGLTLLSQESPDSADAVTLLKRIRKFSMAQDIGARAAVHIFNRISFAIAKGVRAKEVPGWVLELLEESDEEVQSDDVFMEGDNKENDRNVNGPKSKKCNKEDVFAGRDGDSTNRGSKGDASESTPNAEENDRNVNGDASESVCTGRFKKPEVSRTGESFFCLMEEVVKVGQIIAVYAPHDSRDKHMLWDYMVHTINQWDGEVIIVGDFNKVRNKSDRFCSIFNGQGADEFNSFIANSGLEEVPLGRSAFTWCHKSATKMRKLDRFLISENLFITCPHIIATTLERYLSNHRPILLRETSNDYGPVPFRFFHHWIELEGFNNFVVNTWKTALGDASNGMRNMTYIVVHKRMEVINALQRIDKLNAMEIAQKTKIKWVSWLMEFGMKSRMMLNENFFQHFSNRFDKPIEHRAVVDMSYLSHFFTHADIPKGCNPSLIALIPKIPDANKLVSVLGDIVNEVQSAFIAKRKILDGPFILNERVVDAGLFMAIKLSILVNLSHMFYAYDAVFVGQWSDNNINMLIHVLDCFYRASGLRMNMSKSKIMGVHVKGGMVKHVASKLGCRTLNTPFYYLGSKVGGSISRVQAWKEVIDKVKSRLSKWKMKALSIGGRLTLLKSVLGSIPIFHMSIFRVPSSVLHTLESIRSQFFNGHEVGSNKATWVKWNSVLMAKDSGGLGVSSLYALNRGLMMKWVWRFYNQKTSLWAIVIKEIHEEDGSMGKAKYVGVRTCWTTIVNEIRILSNQGVNVLEFMRLKLGNGDMVSFWNDNWSGGGVLKYLYPRLYSLENGKSVNVCTKLSDPSMDYSFRHKTRGGAGHEQLDALMDLVSTVNLVSIGDRRVWTLESSGEFSMASLRKVIDEKRLPRVRSKTRWVKYVPIKVNVLAWKIKMDVLPTRLNISRRSIDIHSISCLNCDCGVESLEHLFFRCNLTRQIARKISLWWNVNYEDVNSYDEWSAWMVSLRLATESKLMFECVFYVMWWNIWIYRNKLLFEDKVLLKAIIFDNVVSNSFYWYRFRCKASHREFNQIVIPIFYHVDPSDVRKQQNSFGDAMADHKQKMEAETNAEKKK
nr:RNA-directed DNA polymerase, eukaryota, reverse transcriptase zinc-binding domain protein [Tanacetum cinerariifolium]